MKNSNFTVHLFLPATILAGLIFFFHSCKKDLCLNETCSKHGSSYSTKDYCFCTCNAGYEGAKCETESRTKFLGVYSFTENCSPSGSKAYLLAIDTSSSAVNKINIFNIYNQGITVSATVSGATLTIASQAFGSNTISGSGTLGSTLSLTYAVNISGTNDNCSGTGTK